ncbi:MAG TPA: helix-turn-helix transcriptional regulator [Polyangiales bacterium]
MQGRSKQSIDWPHITAACYEPLPGEAWVANLLEALAPLLDWGMGVGFSICEEEVNGRRVPMAAGTKAMVQAFVVRSLWELPRFDAETYRAMYYPRGFIVRASSAFRRAAGAQKYLEKAQRKTDLDDAVGLLMYPRPGTVALVTTFFKGTLTPAPTSMAALHQLRMHLESALRLRLNDPGDAVAVLRHDGSVEHAVDQGREPVARAALAHHARLIELARSAPERARLWKALVQGRWTLVPRVQENGRVKYYAYENGPRARRAHALSEFECAVIRRLLIGSSAKAVASDLGVVPSAVSRALMEASMKLGLRRRVDLMRVASSIIGASRHTGAHLSASERDVLRLLCEGRSNADIARQRGTSPNTTANQVSSIVRKTGVSSRHALWGLVNSLEPELVLRRPPLEPGAEEAGRPS